MHRLRFLYSPSSESRRTDEPVLSVYREHGVIPKASRSDNFNRTPEDLSRYLLVRPGDLVVNRMKAWQGSLGVSSHRGIVSGDYEVLRPRDGAPLVPRFAHYLLRSRPLVAEYRKRSTGIRPSQWRIYWEQLADVRISLPSREVQAAIADFLDHEATQVASLITQQERFIALLSERRTAVQHTAVTGARVHGVRKPSGLAWAESVPEHWAVANIRRFAVMKTGHTPSRSDPRYWEDCTVPWFTLADVHQLRDGRQMYVDETKSRISELGLANSAAELLPARTVVLSRTASVGFSGVMTRPMATSQDYWNWVCSPGLLPEYLVYTFRAMRDEFAALMRGSTHKTIYQPVAAALRIPVPPLREQHQIVDELRGELARIDELIDEVHAHISLAKERRESLITAAVTGQIELIQKGA